MCVCVNVSFHLFFLFVCVLVFREFLVSQLFPPSQGMCVSKRRGSVTVEAACAVLGYPTFSGSVFMILWSNRGNLAAACIRI